MSSPQIATFQAKIEHKIVLKRNCYIRLNSCDITCHRMVKTFKIGQEIAEFLFSSEILRIDKNHRKYRKETKWVHKYIIASFGFD